MPRRTHATLMSFSRALARCFALSRRRTRCETQNAMWLKWSIMRDTYSRFLYFSFCFADELMCLRRSRGFIVEYMSQSSLVSSLAISSSLHSMTWRHWILVRGTCECTGSDEPDWGISSESSGLRADDPDNDPDCVSLETVDELFECLAGLSKRSTVAVFPLASCSSSFCGLCKPDGLLSESACIGVAWRSSTSEQAQNVSSSSLTIPRHLLISCTAGAKTRLLAKRPTKFDRSLRVDGYAKSPGCRLIQSERISRVLSWDLNFSSCGPPRAPTWEKWDWKVARSLAGGANIR